MSLSTTPDTSPAASLEGLTATTNSEISVGEIHPTEISEKNSLANEIRYYIPKGHFKTDVFLSAEDRDEFLRLLSDLKVTPEQLQKWLADHGCHTCLSSIGKQRSGHLYRMSAVHDAALLAYAFVSASRKHGSASLAIDAASMYVEQQLMQVLFHALKADPEEPFEPKNWLETLKVLNMAIKNRQLLEEMYGGGTTDNSDDAMKTVEEVRKQLGMDPVGMTAKPLAGSAKKRSAELDLIESEFADGEDDD